MTQLNIFCLAINICTFIVGSDFSRKDSIKWFLVGYALMIANSFMFLSTLFDYLLK